MPVALVVVAFFIISVSGLEMSLRGNLASNQSPINPTRAGVAPITSRRGSVGASSRRRGWAKAPVAQHARFPYVGAPSFSESD